MAKSTPRTSRSTRSARSNAGEGLLVDEAAQQSGPEPARAPGSGIALDSIVGQEHAIGRLRDAVDGGRLHHAYIFHGAHGVGKFTSACALARALLDPRDGSAASSQARAGTHPDLHIIRKELAAISRVDRIRKGKQTTIAVDVLREFLIEPAGLAAVGSTSSPSGQGQRASKVFIVDEAELIDPTGQNALLKTLEEPPAGTVIILVTSALDRLLATVRSRCQPVLFVPLSESAMATWLQRSGLGRHAAERSWLMWFADGSPGLAELAARRGLFAWEDAVGPGLAAALRGAYQATLGPELARLTDEQVGLSMKEQPDASKESTNRAWARHMFAFLARRIRDDLRGGGTAGARAGGPQIALSAIDALQEAERAMSANVRISDVMESLSVRLSTLVRVGVPA
ncbi:MAG: ATP-binding protein [Phycisphaerales bacterium]